MLSELCVTSLLVVAGSAVILKLNDCMTRTKATKIVLHLSRGGDCTITHPTRGGTGTDGTGADGAGDINDDPLGRALY